MKQCRNIALAATSGTLLLAIMSVLLRYNVIEAPTGANNLIWASRLMQPIASKVYIPAACALLLSMTLAGKIKLWQCGIWTMINITICGVGIIAKWDVYAWFVNLQMPIMNLSPVWFAAIGIYGVVKKRPLIWGVCGFQLILLVVLMIIPATSLGETYISGVFLNGTCIAALVFIVGLSGFDYLMEKRGRADSEGAVFQGNPSAKQRRYSILAIALAAAAVMVCLLILLISYVKKDALLFTGQQVHVHLRTYLLHITIVPAVCTALAGLSITKRITTRWSVLLMLISMGAAVLINVATRMTGISEIYKPGYWATNTTEASALICTVLLVFFAVLGSVEKKSLLLWIGMTMPLLQMIYSFMVNLELMGTQFRWTAFCVMNLVPLLLLTIIGYYDYRTSRKEAEKVGSVSRSC